MRVESPPAGTTAVSVVVRSSTCCPARATRMVIGCFGRACTRFWKSCHWVIGWPSSASSESPGWSPARAAAVLGPTLSTTAGRHGWTACDT